MKIDKITLPEPPNVLKSIRNGFDAITKHLILLLFPLGVDLVLWFAPHLQLKSLIEGLILEMSEVSALMPADFRDVMVAGQEIWLIGAERINLFLALRSIPVGIFSLLSSILPVEHPLGSPIFWDVTSAGLAILISIGIFLIGIGVASIYFSSVRQAAIFDEIKWGTVFRDWPRASIQSLLLSLIWLILFLAILVVGSCAATGVTFISISLGQIVIILFGIVSFWLIFPLFFSPHGIFSQREQAWKSLIDSIRFTNMTFMRTSLFIIIAILVNQGLYIVWQIPPENSWLMMISIIGHAFVTTGMLAASFVYYQEMIRWIEELQVLSAAQSVDEERPALEQ